MKKLSFIIVMLFVGIMAAQAQMPTDNSYLRENYNNSKTAQRAAEKRAIRQARKEAKKAEKLQAKAEKLQAKIKKIKTKDSMPAMKLVPAKTTATAATTSQPAAAANNATTANSGTTATNSGTTAANSGAGNKPVLYVKTKEGTITTQNNAKNEAMQKIAPYLEGAVPTTQEGIVFFERTMPFSNKTKQQAYNILKSLAEEKIKESQHLNISRIVSESADTLMATICEPVYFKRKAWESDSTVIKYQYLATIKDNEAKLRIWFINYCYEQSPEQGFNIKAEEWITDKHGLTKDKMNLAKVTGKFRQKTIDYTNEIFAILEERLLQPVSEENQQ